MDRIRELLLNIEYGWCVIFSHTSNGDRVGQSCIMLICLSCCFSVSARMDGTQQHNSHHSNETLSLFRSLCKPPTLFGLYSRSKRNTQPPRSIICHTHNTNTHTSPQPPPRHTQTHNYLLILPTPPLQHTHPHTYIHTLG